MNLRKITAMWLAVQICSIAIAASLPAGALQKPKSSIPKSPSGASQVGTNAPAPKPEARFLGNLTDQRINESSGIARGDVTKGILWTHNDSGDGPFLFAIN